MQTISSFPIDRSFNAAIMTMANRYCPKGWDVTDDETKAPDTLQGIIDYAQTHNKVMVWTGASDDTIYGCPEHNWAFRAWHDHVHFAYRYDLTPEGEAKAGEVQVLQMYERFGFNETTLKWGAYILCEIIGQAKYMAEQGRFPASQTQFFADHWNDYVMMAAEIGFKHQRALRLAA